MPAYNYNTRTLENSNSPSGRYNPVTPGGIYGDATGRYTARMFGSDLLRSAAPTPVAAASSLTGNWLRSGTDRLFRAGNDRDAREYAQYQQNMLQEDANAYSPGVMGSIAEWARNLFGGGRDEEQEQSAPARAPVDNRTYGQQQTIAPQRAAPTYQGNRAGSAGSTVIAQRTGDAANDRALESMAEGLLGQDAVSRMNASSRQSIDMMNRMFGNKFK